MKRRSKATALIYYELINRKEDSTTLAMLEHYPWFQKIFQKVQKEMTIQFIDKPTRHSEHASTLGVTHNLYPLRPSVLSDVFAAVFRIVRITTSSQV